MRRDTLTSSALRMPRMYTRAALAIFSVAVTFILYIIFSGLLSVNLPRGTIEFLRNFALAIEGVVQNIKNLF